MILEEGIRFNGGRLKQFRTSSDNILPLWPEDYMGTSKKRCDNMWLRQYRQLGIKFAVYNLQCSISAPRRTAAFYKKGLMCQWKQTSS